MAEAAPTMTLTIRVNSQPVTLEIEPREMLLDVVRDRLGLTGAKRSCDVQVCGACTLLIDGIPVSACCTTQMAGWLPYAHHAVATRRTTSRTRSSEVRLTHSTVAWAPSPAGP